MCGCGNLLVPGSEGGVTYYLPTMEEMPIYDAALRYQADGTPLIVLAGKDYGMGSSRDWAAKGTQLLGIRAVIAESIERIHRSNLVMMGVLPLTFNDGESYRSLGLTGHETFDIPISDDVRADGQAEGHGEGRGGRRKAIRGHGAVGYAGGGRILSQRRYLALRCCGTSFRSDISGRFLIGARLSGRVFCCLR